MADEVKGTGAPSAPAGDAAPAKEQQPVTYAGKFQTADALYTGLAEIRKVHGLPDLPVETLKAAYADAATAEIEYKGLQSALGKRAKDGGKTESILDKTKPADPAPDPVLDAEDVPIQQVLAKAGVSEAEIYSEVSKTGAVSDDLAEKIRVNHPTLSRVPKATALRTIRTEIQQQVRETQRVIKEAETVAGGADELAVLIKDRDKYVPAEKRDKINKWINSNDDFVEAVEQIKKYRDSNQPKPTKGTVSGDRSPASTNVAARKMEIHRELNRNPNQPALLAELKRLVG